MRKDSTGRTLELLFEASAGGDAKGTDELLEVNLPAVIRIEDVEDVVCEFSGVAEREELLVYPAELFLVEMAGGAVLLEALVPVDEIASESVRESGKSAVTNHC